MRLTEFWERMELVLGAPYSRSWARDVVLPALGGRTCEEAIEAGMPTKEIWRAVCETLPVPATLR